MGVLSKSVAALFMSGGKYEIGKSLRFRAAASAYLQRTIATLSNRKTQTISVWVKRGTISTSQMILGYYQSANNHQYVLRFQADDTLALTNVQSGSVNASRVTIRLFRDPAAWYHIVGVFDTTNATAGDRVKVFVNGVQETSFSTTVNPTLDADLMINFASQPLGIGREQSNLSASYGYFDGYLSEFNFIDGQALEPTDFGRTDPTTGQWVPRAYTGTYGTNGFYLPFSNGTNLTTLVADASGNGNDWTANNISLTSGVTYDWMDDTPTNNFAVLNPIGSNGTISNANLTVSNATNVSTCSFHVNAGKWYWEFIPSSVSTTIVGITPSGNLTLASGTYGYRNSGNDYISGSNAAYGATYTTSDVVGGALDMDAGTITFYKNGVSQGVLASSISGFYTPMHYASTAAGSFNFGQRPFAYTPPTGFKALCTKNLPNTAAKKGSVFMQTILDTGANIKAAAEAVFGNGLYIIKDRANTNNWQWIDFVRGTSAILQSNTTAAETTYSAPSGNSVAYVFKEQAGFLDIVTYTGTGVARTVPHDLGVPPALGIFKGIGAADSWFLYHKGNTAAPETDYLSFTTAATADLNTIWNDTAPTSTEFTVGTNTDINGNGKAYVAMLFAEVEGFSKFNSFTGNASADGYFVYCGFRPAFVEIKRTDSTGSYITFDTERNTHNPAGTYSSMNLTNAETVFSGIEIDIVSNGFKVRGTNANINASAGTYITMAFAETPFKYANAR